MNTEDTPGDPDVEMHHLTEHELAYTPIPAGDHDLLYWLAELRVPEISGALAWDRLGASVYGCTDPGSLARHTRMEAVIRKVHGLPDGCSRRSLDLAGGPFPHNRLWKEVRVRVYADMLDPAEIADRWDAVAYLFRTRTPAQVVDLDTALADLFADLGGQLCPSLDDLFNDLAGPGQGDLLDELARQP